MAGGEFGSNNPLELVFSDDYWGESCTQQPYDQGFSLPRWATFNYPELGPKAIRYLGGDDAIALPRGTYFYPNSASKDSWYCLPGGLLVFDQEWRTTYLASTFDELPKWRRPQLTQSELAVQLVDLSPRQMLATDLLDGPLGEEILLLKFFSVAQRDEEQIAVYRRRVVAAVIQKFKGVLTGRQVVINLFEDKAGLTSTPLAAIYNAPFEVGQTTVIPKPADSQPEDIEILQRTRSVEVLEVGEKQRSRSRVFAREVASRLIPALKPGFSN